MQSHLLRTWLLALLVVAVWFGSVELDRPWRVVPASAPADSFSAARAETTLRRLLGSQQPHPLSSEQNAALRARILAEFASLGIPATTYRAFTCNTWLGFGFVPCATVTDILAEVLPGPGKAVVMMAHYDSVPAGPGASDDAAGVAAVLEAARALRAGRPGGPKGAPAAARHPVLALLTDGEEAGLLGARAFLQSPELRGRAGAVVNLEARGTNGPSLLFQTSPGDARLIDLYAAQVPLRDTSSLYSEVYRHLPNDTDLTLFIRAGIASFNFAFVGNERYYHSPLDRRAELSAASLQMQGDNLLGVVRGLEQTSYTDLSGGNAIYLSIFDRLLPRLPEGWALPLAIVAFVALAVASALARSAFAGSAFDALWMPPALLAAALAVGLLLAWMAQQLSGMPDPTYAYPTATRLALAAGLWAVTLAVSRAVGVRTAAAGAWLWLSGLGILVAALLPGLSPYFLFPSLVAAVLLLVTARAPGGWSGRWGQLALLLAGLSALIVWIGLAAGIESLLGLRLEALFISTAAFGVLTLVPLLAAHPSSRSGARASIGTSAAVALAAGIVAGLLPAYNARSPQRIDLIYYQSPTAAHWIVDSSWRLQRAEPIARALITAGHLRRRRLALPGLGIDDAYVGPAVASRLPLPSASVTIATAAPAALPAAASPEPTAPQPLRTVTLQLHGSPDTDAMILDIPAAAHLRAIDIGQQHLVVPQAWHRATRLACESRDCRDATVTLTVAGSLSELPLVEERYGLPTFGADLAASRPPTAMPSQSGDEVMLANVLHVPGGP